jgi:hypothetical protein
MSGCQYTKSCIFGMKKNKKFLQLKLYMADLVVQKKPGRLSPPGPLLI